MEDWMNIHTMLPTNVKNAPVQWNVWMRPPNWLRLAEAAVSTRMVEEAAPPAPAAPGEDADDEDDDEEEELLPDVDEERSNGESGNIWTKGIVPRFYFAWVFVYYAYLDAFCIDSPVGN